jgi:hypothetical protein
MLNYIRLEVGTAHRRGGDKTIQLCKRRLIMYRHHFVHGAPVGGAHL